MAECKDTVLGQKKPAIEEHMLSPSRFHLHQVQEQAGLIHSDRGQVIFLEEVID